MVWVSMKTELTIDVWSDIACPWCWVGKRRLEAALAQFEHRDPSRGGCVALRWRAFELDASAPPAAETGGPYAPRLARKYGMPLAQAEAAIARLTEVAAADGLDMRFDRIRPGNTFDGHRLVHLAHESGLEDAMKERLFKAYLSEGQSMSDRATLVRLAVEVGLDRDAATAALEGDAFSKDVRGDEAEASEIGVRGVPFFVIGSKYAVSGAQPADLLLGALEKAWSELPQRLEDVSSEGAACGPAGCEV